MKPAACVPWKAAMDTLTLVQNRISTRETEHISHVLGESLEGTQAALSLSSASLLGSLIGKVNASTTGSKEVFDILNHQQRQGGWPENIGHVIDGFADGLPQLQHQLLLTSLLGQQVGAVSNSIATSCKIRMGSAILVLGIATPFLLGTLLQQVSSAGIGPAGLGHLLRAQAPFVARILPAQLAEILGISYLFRRTRNVHLPPARPEHARWRGFEKWAWVAALMLMAWFAHRQLSPLEMGGTADAGPDGTMSGQDYRTSDTSNLDLRVEGFADELARAVSSGGKNRFIDMPTNTLKDDSLTDAGRNSIRQLAVIMLANPNTHIHIIGRGQTEETGSELATGIKSNLVLHGVNESRISISGEIGRGSPTLFIVPELEETLPVWKETSQK